MRAWVVVVAIVVAVMGAGFGLGNLHPFGDPRVEPAEGLGTLLQGAKMPAEAKAVLVSKCADSHSCMRQSSRRISSAAASSKPRPQP